MTDPVAAPYSGIIPQITTAVATTNNRTSDLGQDAFLKLLTVQLSNQDPMSPMSNEEFISQMAQLQTLEQTMTMTKSFDNLRRNQELGAASGLIGKSVRAFIPGTGDQEDEEVTGTVTSVRISDNNVNLVVGGKEVALDNVLEVTNTDAKSPDNTNIEGNGGVVDLFLPPA